MIPVKYPERPMPKEKVKKEPRKRRPTRQQLKRRERRKAKRRERATKPRMPIEEDEAVTPKCSTTSTSKKKAIVSIKNPLYSNKSSSKTQKDTENKEAPSTSRKTSYNTIFYCPHCSDLSQNTKFIVHRDVNGVRNIFRCLVSMLFGLQRPSSLCRSTNSLPITTTPTTSKTTKKKREQNENATPTKKKQKHNFCHIDMTIEFFKLYF